MDLGGGNAQHVVDMNEGEGARHGM